MSEPSSHDTVVPQTPPGTGPPGDPPDTHSHDAPMDDAMQDELTQNCNVPKPVTHTNTINQTSNSSTPVPNALLSFRDILNGDHRRQRTMKKVEDLLAQKKIVLQYKDNDPLLPQFTLSEALKDSLKYPWEKSLIVKALGRNVG